MVVYVSDLGCCPVEMRREGAVDICRCWAMNRAKMVDIVQLDVHSEMVKRVRLDGDSVSLDSCKQPHVNVRW